MMFCDACKKKIVGQNYYQEDEYDLCPQCEKELSKAIRDFIKNHKKIKKTKE